MPVKRAMEVLAKHFCEYGLLIGQSNNSSHLIRWNLNCYALFLKDAPPPLHHQGHQSHQGNYTNEGKTRSLCDGT